MAASGNATPQIEEERLKRIRPDPPHRALAFAGILREGQLVTVGSP